MRYACTATLLLLLFSLGLAAQRPEVEIVQTGPPVSLRGLSVVNDNVIWVSGSKGTVGRSANGGKTWKWISVKGFEKKDFRDIEAFDAMSAVIMSVDTPAYILKTIDGGESWKVVYENHQPGMFLDAMEFWNERAGIVIGDPIDGRFFVARSFDGGDSWQAIPVDKRPAADSGEACFAASGTNIRAADRDEAVFVSGGMVSRLHSKHEPVVLPLLQGKETQGANSIAVWDKMKLNGGKNMVIVGGDFGQDSLREKTCVFTRDGGHTWQTPSTPPHGYRSCVEFFSRTDLFACGLNGVDFSTDGGKNWKWISKESFHVCRASKLGGAVYFADNKGRIGRIVWK